ncbi:hypothetical protein GQ55_8G054200 [Panicum hallii var. hallii]|uniref:Uncharacterized protein n=1 Tax=Panicum hallii var. hallii TaxID=1504633 RepID=A0A2T7CKZ7_9POAL|nr:hypothetical protein GQ55_8G054200 [Panicum hallii var. hallii]
MGTGSARIGRRSPVSPSHYSPSLSSESRTRSLVAAPIRPSLLSSPLRPPQAARPQLHLLPPYRISGAAAWGTEADRARAAGSPVASAQRRPGRSPPLYLSPPPPCRAPSMPLCPCIPIFAPRGHHQPTPASASPPRLRIGR